MLIPVLNSLGFCFVYRSGKDDDTRCIFMIADIFAQLRPSLPQNLQLLGTPANSLLTEQ